MMNNKSENVFAFWAFYKTKLMAFSLFQPFSCFQYDTLIEDFKNVHKELETVKNSGYSTIELRKDIEEMEKEKDIVEKRIERMQRKVEGAPNVEVMMEAVKQLRAEKEKQKELLNQRSEQRIGKNAIM